MAILYAPQSTPLPDFHAGISDPYRWAKATAFSYTAGTFDIGFLGAQVTIADIATTGGYAAQLDDLSYFGVLGNDVEVGSNGVLKGGHAKLIVAGTTGSTDGFIILDINVEVSRIQAVGETPDARDDAALIRALLTGDDILLGVEGSWSDETLSGGTGKDALLGYEGDDLLNGGRGGDLVLGGAGADRLIGGDGRDLLAGGAGADVLRGDAGADVLYAESGADSLAGGQGADLFILTSQSDGACILDFEAGRDLIGLEFAHTGFRDIRITADGAGGTRIEVQGISFTLRGVRPAQLEAADFRFAHVTESRLEAALDHFYDGWAYA
ncbi:Hemolysin-type calcium-binding repeat-containing protein [Gemmobacter aquatilis]|uniref:Hemolysin-type calcium-binding repeat-containing protein n=1 Tax=Gemmobacter aquatilis TaxID=933059 RepID=A0A1H8JM35_9RHOB|nr:hypothetical protein [Gemmobacter aquatilis]SEN81621.1 Hemolysin-type calcium-binding repeat-containing protein [Gemmobacter aquatilis]